VKEVMVTIFRDSEDVLMIDHLQKDHTITGEYFAYDLRQMKEPKKGKVPRTICRTMHQFTQNRLNRLC
jgi:hypothetical protein